VLSYLEPAYRDEWGDIEDKYAQGSARDLDSPRDPLSRRDPYMRDIPPRDFPPRNDHLLRRERNIYGPPTRDSYDSYQVIDYDDKKLQKTIDYGHGRDAPSRDLNSDRPRDSHHSLHPADRYKYSSIPKGGLRNDRPGVYGRKDNEREKETDRERREDRRDDRSRERKRDERFRERDRDRDRDRRDRNHRNNSSTSSKPSDFLRRIEERERERSQRDSFRDYEMLYENPRSKEYATENRIPEDELKPEVIAAMDILDDPGRSKRPSNVRL